MHDLATSSWGIACNFDDNSNLLSVLCGRSGVPGRVPYAGFSRPEYYSQTRNIETKQLSRKRKAISNPPATGTGISASAANEPKSDEMEDECETLKPSQIGQWEAQHPVVRPSQFPGHRLRKSIQKQIKEGKCPQMHQPRTID